MAATRKKLTPGKKAAGGGKKVPSAGTAKSVKKVAKKAAKKTVGADLPKTGSPKKAPANKVAAKRPPAKKPVAKATRPAKTAATVKVATGRKAPVKKAAPAKTRPAATKVSTKAAASPVSAELGALEVAHKAAAILFAKKAEEVVLLDLRALSTVADYYLICTCQNEPQMRAILSSMQRTLSREGIKALRSEYMPGVRWAVMDYADLIIHLFEKQTRGFYSLERLWADAPSLELKASDYALPEEMEADGDDDEL